MEKLDKWLPLLGVDYVILGIAGVIVAGDSPGFPAGAEEAATYLVDDTSKVLGSGILWMLSLVFLFFFVGVLRSRLRRTEGDDDRLSWTASTAAAAGTAIVAISLAIQILGALRADEDGEIAPGLAQLFADMSNIIYGAAAPTLFGIAVLAVAGLTFRHGGFIPKWLAWISVAFAIVAFIPPISWVFMFFLFNLWVLVVSILLFLEGRNDAVPASAADGAGVGDEAL